MIDVILDILTDAIVDTLRLLPFLLVVYLLLEWLEHKAGNKTRDAVLRAGVAGPFVGALLGVVPQCGFSAVGATLYAGRVITLGTLFAVFLSTSDELLPLMIAESAPIDKMVAILATKAIIGMVMGFAIDAVLHVRHVPKEQIAIHKLCEQDKCACAGDCKTCSQNPELTYEHEEVLASCTCEHHKQGQACEKAEHQHAHDHTHAHILKSACIHTAQVCIFVFLISIVLGGAFEVAGEDALATLFSASPVLTVFLSALVGLIPNCAASVGIAQLYLEGVLSFAAAMSGLLTSAGVGLLVLCRNNRAPAQNVRIIALLYVMGILWGLLFLVLGISF